MKMKKKFVLGGFVLVAIASVILFMSFGVPAKKSIPKGTKVVVRELKPLSERITALVTHLDLAMVNLRGLMLGIYDPLARCIKNSLAKAGIETTGIVLIPDLRSGRTFFYFNTMDLTIASSRSPNPRWEETATYYTIGRGAPRWQGHTHGGGTYSWNVTETDSGDEVRVWGEDDRSLCSFDTGNIREIVHRCQTKHELLTEENSRIYVATNQGWVVINGSGEVVACNDYVG